MAPEIFWLTLTVVLTALMVTPYAVYRANAIGGLWQVFLRPLPGDNPFDDEWAHRAYRAHMNAFEGLALFAPLAIAVYITNAGNEITAYASATFFWARLTYAPLYYLNVPIFRTAIWMIGLIATLVLAYVLVA